MRVDGAEAESLRHYLDWLRKNEGFVQRRLARTSVLDRVLRGTPEDTYERLKNRFISAIHSLADTDEKALLLDVFALSEETQHCPRLQHRRAIHGAKIQRGIDTVASRESAALSHLHSRLVTGTYAQSPMVLHVPEMHGGIIYEHTSSLVVVQNRRWRETRELYRFANMHGDLDYVTVTRSYEGVVHPHTNGAFKVNTRAVPGAGYNDHFWHLDAEHAKTEPMRHGEVYDLRFRIEPMAGDEAAQEPIKLASRAFHHRTLLASIQVGFIGEKPSSIWTFEQVSPYARPAEANEYTRTELDERGVATLRLRDVHGGLFSGVAWAW